MEKNFYKPISAHKSDFLKKKKNQISNIQKSQKQYQAILRIQSFFRKILCRNKFVNHLINQSHDKLILVLIKKKEIEFKKFAKMMFNAVYKMPNFFRALIFINEHNLKNFKSYIKLIIESIVSEQHQSSIINKIYQRGGFHLYQLTKLVKFSIILLKQNEVYQLLLCEFLQIISNTNFFQRQIYKAPFQNQIIKILQSPLYPSLNQALFQYFYIKSKTIHISQKDHLSILLNNLIYNPEILKQNKINILKNFDLKTNKYISHLIQAESLDWQLTFFSRLQKWMLFIQSKYKDQEILSHAFALNAFILNILYNRYELQEIVKRWDYDFYSIKLFQILKQTKMETGNRLSNYQHSIVSLMNIFIKISIKMTENKIIMTVNKQQQRNVLLKVIYIYIEKLIIQTQSHFNSDQIIIFEMYVHLIEFVLSKQNSKNSYLIDFFKINILDLIKNLMKCLKQILNISIQFNTINYLLKTSFIKIISNLYSKILRLNPSQISMFELHDIASAYTKNQKNYQNLQKNQLLYQIPFIFSLELKIKILRKFIQDNKKKFKRKLNQQTEQERIIRVSRGQQFFSAIQAYDKMQIRDKHKIVFINKQGYEEPGIGYGNGFLTQFLNSTIKYALDPNFGLFKQNELGELIPIKTTNKNSKFYEFIGKIYAKAIYENIIIDIKLSSIFLNRLLKHKHTFTDLVLSEPTIYDNLRKIWEIEDVQACSLFFTYFDGQKQIELIAGGANKKVTNQNKQQFIKLFASYKLDVEFQEALTSFAKGFYQIIQYDWIKFMSWYDLQLILSGKSSNFDTQDLYKYAIYQGYIHSDITIKYFWQVIQEMNQENKTLFLSFITGSSKPPTLGFKTLTPKFCISKSEELTFLPTAHTCANMLRLPNYKNKQIIKQKLQYSIKSKSGFEFV